MSEKKTNFQRNLKDRHIQMIAIGCAIGTGLFYGSASAIQLAGPAIILNYLIGGIFAYLITRALGEMSVYNPVSGSFSAYAYEYWGDFPGFFSGWNYWFTYIAVSMADISVVGIYMHHWFPDLPNWISSLILFLIVTGINLANVKAFGEVEFFGSLIKVIAILAMIAGGLLIIFTGIGHGGVPIGFSNLYAHGGFMPNGIEGMVLSLVAVTFAFGGTEIIGSTAGEAHEPEKSLPKAINLIISRILIFYIGSVFVLVTLYQWDKIGLTGSPFVEIFSKLGIDAAADILNFVVLTAVLSAYNSCLYSNARMLHGLSLQGNAPAFLSKLDKNGTPRRGVIVSSVCVFFIVIINLIFPESVFPYIMATATISVILNWLMIFVTQIKFRKHIGVEGTKKLLYSLPGSPYVNYIGIAYFLFIIAIMYTMPDLRIAVLVAPVWISVIYIGYRIKIARQKNNLESNKN